MAEELKKINQIEKSIADMQAHIKFLLKRENDEERKLSQIKEQSIRKAVSKITLASQFMTVQHI